MLPQLADVYDKMGKTEKAAELREETARIRAA
jgi:uncharacterized protein HemY